LGQIGAKIAQLAITAYLKRLPALDNDKDTFSGLQLEMEMGIGNARPSAQTKLTKAAI